MNPSTTITGQQSHFSCSKNVSLRLLALEENIVIQKADTLWQHSLFSFGGLPQEIFVYVVTRPVFVTD